MNSASEELLSEAIGFDLFKLTRRVDIITTTARRLLDDAYTYIHTGVMQMQVSGALAHAIPVGTLQ